MSDGVLDGIHPAETRVDELKLKTVQSTDAVASQSLPTPPSTEQHGFDDAPKGSAKDASLAAVDGNVVFESAAETATNAPPLAEPMAPVDQQTPPSPSSSGVAINSPTIDASTGAAAEQPSSAELKRLASEIVDKTDGENDAKRAKLSPQPETAIDDASHAAQHQDEGAVHTASDIQNEGQSKVKEEEEVDSDERQLRTDSVAKLPTDHKISPFTRDQHRHALTALRTLKKDVNAPAFLRPVDPIAMGVPHYLTVITHPMDLSTVEAKLNQTGKAFANASKSGRTFGVHYGSAENTRWEGQSEKVYRTAAAFRADLQQIWNNCYTFNGQPEVNPFSAQAKALESLASSLLLNMPDSPLVDIVQALPQPAAPKAAPKTSNNTASAESRLARPKREVHPPAFLVDSLQNQSRLKRRNSRIATEEIKFCRDLIKDLCKKSNEHITFIFLEPVDVTVYPTYTAVVKKPMDIGTIRRRLETGHYESLDVYDAFERDFRQIVKNCFAFNPIGSAAYDLAQKLEILFLRRWAQRPIGIPPAAEEPEDDPQILQIQQQVEALQANLERFKAKKQMEGGNSKSKSSGGAATSSRQSVGGSTNKRPTVESPTSAIGGSSKKRSAQSSSSSKKKSRGEHGRSDEETELVTYTMKRDLAQRIVQFDGEELERAIEIIRQGRPDLLTDADKEMELDIDMLDQRTLLSLYKYVCPPTQRKTAKSARRVATGGTKRKNLDETKETERINQLEEQLRSFDNPGGNLSTVNTIMPADNVSSDDSSDETGSDSD